MARYSRELKGNIKANEQLNRESYRKSQRERKRARDHRETARGIKRTTESKTESRILREMFTGLQISVNFGSYFRFSLSLSLQTKMHISFSHFQSFLSSLVLVQFSSTKTQNILVQFQSTKSHYILVQFQSHLKVHLIATLNSFTSLLRPGDPLCCVYNCIIVKLAVLKLWMQLVSKIQISQYMPTAEFQ